MRGLFVTGTDTGVGKSVVAGALAAAMCSAGEAVRAHKPVVTGLDDTAGAAASWPADHELLAAAVGMCADEVSPRRYGPALSPHLAAALAGERLELAALLAAVPSDESGALIVEGVGGLLTPLSERLTLCDFAAALGLPLLIAARPGLGTLNHTLLTLRAARAAGLRVAAVVLTPWPARPSALERSNWLTIARMGRVEVVGLGRARTARRRELARIGGALPWRRWLQQGANGDGPAPAIDQRRTRAPDSRPLAAR